MLVHIHHRFWSTYTMGAGPRTQTAEMVAMGAGPRTQTAEMVAMGAGPRKLWLWVLVHIHRLLKRWGGGAQFKNGLALYRKENSGTILAVKFLLLYWQ